VKRLLSAAVAAVLGVAACGQSQSAAPGGDDGGSGDDATVSGDDATSSGADTGSGSGGEGGGHTGPVTCGTASTAWQKNGTQCGSNRWAVKTGTDQTVGQVNMTPQVTTVQKLMALPTNAPGSCTRGAEEAQVYELQDVKLRFEHLETDSDYHIVVIDSVGNTMIAEVPYPDCVGQNSCNGSSTPWLCEITHARAAVDAKNPTQVYGDMGVGTVIGPAFFDTYELQNNPRPTGMASNGVELHPVLAICFGQGCDPLQGY
jgi:hypothetical protein